MAGCKEKPGGWYSCSCVPVPPASTTTCTDVPPSSCAQLAQWGKLSEGFAALITLPLASSPLISCLCKSWYVTNHHCTGWWTHQKAAVQRKHIVLAVCTWWPFVFCWFYFFTPNKAWRFFFFFSLLFIQKAIMRDVCLHGGMFCGRSLKSEFPGFFSLLDIFRTEFEPCCANSNQML